MLNTLIISGINGDAQRYRCVHTQEQLTLCGARARVYYLISEDLCNVVAENKVIIFHRVSFDRYVRKLCSRARAAGVLVIFDTDDLVFKYSALLSVAHGFYRDSPMRRALLREEVKGYQETMHHSDAVLVSTEYLAQEASELKRPIWVHRNAFSFEMLSRSERARNEHKRREHRIIIGYASGTATHNRDFQEAKPALQQVMRKHPEIELWIVGHLDPGSNWGELTDRIKRIPFMPWQKLPQFMAQFDINLVPLELKSPFCQAKSEIKYVEAGLVGVPTIAGRTDAFAYAIRPGDNGLLAETEDDWYQHLELLIADRTLRQQMGERAHQDVLLRYHPIVRARELTQTLRQIGRSIGASPSWPELSEIVAAIHHPESVAKQAGDADPPSLKPPSLWRLVWYTLRYRGVRILLMRAWVYVCKFLG
jgi:glycosyltransferase involved in cell wall biosynthesis